ncbi:Putative flavoprotein [Fulvivirga imtechensis AK7]|uniref:Putative flavoprotein n=1 Tax=Fulvivirga imtechensis AK7 TaxID=1237149 RepID=L8JXX7_9BACT|nr:NADPH-dependent FMN reductase [Fulvivirga imtechensis]ELR72494.1 Putative flavoprotein [Fulvivirga imtechensis AK7]
MKIAIILGSVRKERQSHRLAFFLENQLANRGMDINVIDMANTPLPVFGQKGVDDSAVEEVGKILQESDALIIVTPEYHGSYSGALKNMLDYYWAEFKKKPIGVAAASGGKMAGINASTQLQHVILSLGAYALPLKLLVPEIQKAFNDSFEPLNETIARSANKFLDEFLWFTEAIVAKKELTEVV